MSDRSAPADFRRCHRRRGPAGAKRPAWFAILAGLRPRGPVRPACMLVIWEFCIWFFDVPKYLLPVAVGIAASLKGLVAVSAAATSGRALSRCWSGSRSRSSPGSGSRSCCTCTRPLRRAVYPILIGSQTIPIVVLAPILVILLGYGLLPKVVIVALICFFPIVVNGLDGLRSVDDDFIRMMRTLDASRWAIFRKVEFPGALPSIFSGMRVAATFAAIGAVFGEWSGASDGLGYLIQASTRTCRPRASSPRSCCSR